jgi:hypothetical protein
MIAFYCSLGLHFPVQCHCPLLPTVALDVSAASDVEKNKDRMRNIKHTSSVLPAFPVSAPQGGKKSLFSSSRRLSAGILPEKHLLV